LEKFQPVFTDDMLWAESEIKIQKFKKVILQVFSQQKRGKIKVKIARLHLWLPLCSQTYRRMIKHLYFISASSPDLAKPS
jgi:hypothetical protein